MSTIDEIRVHAQAILDLCGPAATAPVCHTPADLDAAYIAAVAGDTLLLGTDLGYPSLFTVDKAITLKSETWAARVGLRMTADEPAPRFLAGLYTIGDGHSCRGLEVRHPDPNAAVTWQSANHALWDRMRIMGHPVNGARRGIIHFGSDFTLTNSFIDDCFHASEDAQAFLAYDCGAGITLVNNYLAGSGQSVMFGGGDASSAERVPSGILIDNCDLTKKPAWIGVQQCKCALEFKAAKSVVVQNSRLSYGGTNAGQGCYLIDATVRNQDGNAPWSTVENIEVKDCVGSHTSGIMNILGTDNVHPSGTLDGLNIHDCQFTDMDGNLGHARLFILGGGPKHVRLDHLTISAVNEHIVGYFYSPTPPIGMTLTNLTYPNGAWGNWNLDGDTGHAGQGPAKILEYAPDAVLDGTVKQG